MTGGKLELLFGGVRTNPSLTKQSLIAAIAAAYIGALVFFVISQVWRFQTGGDARICPVGSQSLSDWCTIGELSLAFLFDFLWALYGLPFALVLTLPCAFALGRLAPPLEGRFDVRALAAIQYALGTAIGLIAGLLLQAVTVGVLAALTGVWVFRRARYIRPVSQSPFE